MQVETPLPATKRPPLWKLLANIALMVGLVAVFAWQVKENWQPISQHEWQINWTYMALSVLLLLLCQGVDILIWNRTLGWFTDALPFRLAAPVYIWSYLARYIPGKVGSLLLRVALSTEVKRHPVPVLTSSTVELALRIGSGMLLFIATSLGAITAATGAEGGDKGPLFITLALIAVPLVLICAHPKIMLPVLNWGLKKIKQQTLDRPLRYREVLGIFVALLLRWVLYGVAYVAMAAAIYEGVVLAQVGPLMGVAAGSWAVGFILLTPAGVGPAEIMQKLVLEGALRYPAEIAVVLPIVARLVTLAGEGIWSLISWLMWRGRAALIPQENEG